MWAKRVRQDSRSQRACNTSALDRNPSNRHVVDGELALLIIKQLLDDDEADA